MQETTLPKNVGLAPTGCDWCALDPLEQHRGPAASYDPRKVSIAQEPEQMVDPVCYCRAVESHAFEGVPVGELQLPRGTRVQR